MNGFTKINEWLAIKVTAGVGTMSCTYIFAMLTLPALPNAVNDMSHGNPGTLVTWVTQTFIQLVLLPIILVGQKLMAEHHKKMMASHAELHAKVDALHAVVSNLKATPKTPAPKVV